MNEPAPSQGGGRSTAGTTVAFLALAVGFGYAGISAYWAVGGTGLLDTLGGVFERWGRSGGAGVAALLWGVVAIKMVASLLPLSALDQLPNPVPNRLVWVLAWTEAAILTIYGLVLTATGLLIQAGVVRASRDADRRALAWHAYLWDPWFLLWGLLVVGALLLGRHRRVGLRTQPELER